MYDEPDWTDAHHHWEETPRDYGRKRMPKTAMPAESKTTAKDIASDIRSTDIGRLLSDGQAAVVSYTTSSDALVRLGLWNDDGSRTLLGHNVASLL